MRRNFLVGLIVCLIPTALAGLFFGIAAYREFAAPPPAPPPGQPDERSFLDKNLRSQFRKGIDLAGGTILVYEVKAPEGKDTALTADDIKKLAENLKRRIDPADLRNVVVRPVGASRVEIILPFAGSAGGKEGANEDFVREVRALVGQAGVLEFRIVANPTDDREGIDDTQKLLQRADPDPKFKEELLDRARKGLPPPVPDRTYTVKIRDNSQDDVRYEWVELGREERDTLGVSNVYATPDQLPEKKRGNTLYAELAAQRGRVHVMTYPQTAGVVLYSRDHIETVKAKDEENKRVEYFMLTRVSKGDSFRVAGDIKLTAQVDSRNLNPAVAFNFNAAGANQFGRVTERNRKEQSFKRQLAVILDKKIVSAPTLDAVIREHGQISGESFDLGGVTRLVYILRSGALNAELKPDPVSENTVGPTLGQDTIRKGLIAVGVSFGAVLLFMVGYYQFAGIVACVALFVNLILTVGFMVMVNAAFTLPGLAGIVLMLGMAVDANVLIYERLREERDKGANLVTAVRLGYDRAFATIIDTHLTSIFTAIVLYTFGNDNLKGFAVSLTVGLIISLFTSLYMTRLMFDFWMHRRWLTALKMHQLFPRPNINFMKVRNLMFALTGALTVLGLGLFLARGEAVLNVDFTKGTAYGGRLKDGRALNDTDGKTGLLTLLGEGRQTERLGVKVVVPLSGGEAAADATDTGARGGNEYVYKIVYADDTEATVTFANPPEGADRDAQLADVKDRAKQLPGLSVEQVYVRGVDDDLPFGTSRSFTVRTTEKEPDLVRVSLDRLLRDEKSGEQLLAVTHVTDVKVTGPVAVLTLDRPTSPGELKAFVTRELRLAGRVPAVGSAVPVEVTGVAAADPAVANEEGRSGKYTTVKVDVSGNPEFKPLRDATEAKKDLATDKKAAEELAAFRRVLDGAKSAFEARPIPDRLETFDPALAADTRNRALYAVALSWMAVLAYLWFRFGSWTFGAAAVICLLHDLCFTLGMIAVCHYLHDTTLGRLLLVQDFKIDLAAVAALLTLVGYSVNDTIVVFDRIREVRGKNPQLTAQTINDSVNQTLSRTVLASLTVFLVVGVLYLFGGEGVHLFSFVMVVGVIVGTYSSIYIASPLLLIFGEGKPRATDRVPAAAAAKPSETVS